MARSVRPQAVLPEGFILQEIAIASEATVITVRAALPEPGCPDCGVPARRVHSRYSRTLLDLPMGGRSVRLRVEARRLRCDTAACTRRIFAERLDRVAPWRDARCVSTPWRTTPPWRWEAGRQRGSPRG